MTGSRPRIAVAMGRDVAGRVLTPGAWTRLGEIGEIVTDRVLDELESAPSLAALGRTDLLVTGWGAPAVDGPALQRAPHLCAIVHVGGSVRGHVTAACWSRGVAVSTAAEANAVPVAEYTLGVILLANKRVFEVSREVAEREEMADADRAHPGLGNFGKTVGVVGASRIGRRVIELLRPFDLEVVVHDPYLGEDEARGLGVTRVSLAELARTADVVTVHAPSLPETAGMISESVIAQLKPGATFVNTSRGELVDQEALVRRLARGDLFAVLDVVTPWQLPKGHPLYRLPNVTLTPHLAGSLGTELHRLADHAIEEVARFAAGMPFRFPVTADDLARMA